MAYSTMLDECVQALNVGAVDAELRGSLTPMLGLGLDFFDIFRSKLSPKLGLGLGSAFKA